MSAQQGSPVPGAADTEADLAKLEILVGPRNDLPFDQWAEQTMRRVLDRLQQLRVSIASVRASEERAIPEPTEGQNRG